MRGVCLVGGEDGADVCVVDYANVLVPLSRGAMKIEEKKLMINKFIEVCGALCALLSGRLTRARRPRLSRCTRRRRSARRRGSTSSASR